MEWEVELHAEFGLEFDVLTAEVQDAILARAKLLRTIRSQLGRPAVDTLQGSSYGNMKELRFTVGKEVWRIAFAFDP